MGSIPAVVDALWHLRNDIFVRTAAATVFDRSNGNAAESAQNDPFSAQRRARTFSALPCDNSFVERDSMVVKRPIVTLRICTGLHGNPLDLEFQEETKFAAVARFMKV